jgi:MFS family permease
VTPRSTFFLVTALRWLPDGALLAVLVVFLLGRGLDLAEVGLVSAVHAAVVLTLELPSGGLADAVGRRPVLVVSAVVGALGFAVLVVADGLSAVLLATVLLAVFRALDSGPLEAWYVDRALAADPRHDLQPDLARAGFWAYLGVAASALTAGAAGLVPGLPVDPLTAAVAVAAVLAVAHAVAVVLLVREEPRAAGGWRALPRIARTTPRVVRESAALGWQQRGLRLLLAVEVTWGAGLTAVELLWQPRTADALGTTSDTWVFGAMTATAWLVAAGGTLAVPPLVRLLRGRTELAAALLRVAQGATVVGLAAAGGLAGIAVAYALFYVVHGAANPLHFTLLHRRVGAEHRATVVSLNSLVARASGLPAALGVGLLAETAGVPLTLAVAAGVLAAGTPLYLLAARDRQRVTS